MESEVVTKEIPLPRDREGRPKMGELLKSIRELVRHAREGDPKLSSHELYDVGFRTHQNENRVEVKLFFR